MLSRTQIRHFLAVVDTGSFTRAAHALNIAQPSLSGGIAELERQLGTRLFVRERRRIRLTQAGNLLLPMARAIEREFHAIQTQVGSLPVPAPPIRLGMLETLSSRWLERALSRHAGPEPLELTEGSERELQSALANGSIDLALTLVQPDARRADSEILFSEDYCLALRANHPLANAGTVAAEAVAGETMIARRACEALAETSRFFTERGVRPSFALRSSNDDRVMAMVRAGLGVTVAPRSFGGPGIALARIADFDLVRHVGLIYGPHWAESHEADHPLPRAIRAAAAECAGT